MRTFNYILILMIILVLPFFAKSESTIEIEYKTREQYEAIDKELNRVYKIALEKIKNSNMSSDLKSKWLEQQKIAQRAWIKFRDEDSKVVEYDWYGGTGMGAAKLGWKIKLTEERIQHLKERYIIDE